MTQGAVSRPTMKDVASLADVSLKTVSRVVNGEPGVSSEKTRAVERAIAHLGFVRNESAAFLRLGHSRSIGLVLQDISEPFQGQLTKAIEEIAYERGSMLLVTTARADLARERDLVRALIARRVDGLIVMLGDGDDDYLRSELAVGVSIVSLDRPLELPGTDSVLADHSGGARAGVAQLVDHGHRRIAFLGDGRRRYVWKERLAGYERALETVGVTLDPRLVHDCVPEDDDAIDYALRSLFTLADPPTAFFSGSVLHTVAILRRLRAWEADVGLVSFDDFRLADVLGITCVTQDALSIGRAAVEVLFSRIDGAGGPAMETKLGTGLVRRGSGEIPVHDVVAPRWRR